MTTASSTNKEDWHDFNVQCRHLFKGIDDECNGAEEIVDAVRDEACS